MTRSTPESRHARELQISLAVFVALLAVVTVVLFLLLRGMQPAGTAALGTTQSPSPTAPTAPTATPAPSITPAPTVPTAPTAPTVTPAPSAVVDVPPNPAEFTPGDWMLASVPLNVRRDPAISAEIALTLAPGDILLVLSETADVDYYRWYQVATLGSVVGWVASGPADAPYATMISDQDLLQTCGPVASEAIINGRRFDFALDPLERSLFTLLAATEGSGCVTLERGDASITSYVDASTHACGAPQWEGDELWLVPTIYGDVAPEFRVQERVHVDETLLTTLAALDADGRSNRHAVMRLASEAAPPFGCVAARVTERGDGREVTIEVNAHGCFIMDSLTPDSAGIRATAEGSVVQFQRMASGHVDSTPLNVPQDMNVTSEYSRSDGQFFSVLDFGACS